jgi:phosphatidylglycerophosphate synthase
MDRMRFKHLAADAAGAERAVLVQYGFDGPGPADWVTLVRATFAVAVAALVVASFARVVPGGLLVTLAAVALALDAVDGWVARRTRTTAAGARFDAEVDAFLILVLSVYAVRPVGAWVLAIGAARYAFLCAGWLLPWLRGPLPPRYWRKVVAATQGIMLTVAAAGFLSPAATTAGLVIALALLAESFGRDVWWLAVTDGVAMPAPPALQPARAPETGPGRARTPASPRRHPRRGIAAGLTALSVVIVWAALVAPDQPRHLTLTGFLRLPLELRSLVGGTETKLIEVSAVRADPHDRSVFAAEIRHDPIAATPTSRLLTGLRGKTVLLVFVEAYGQQAVEGRSFSREVDGVLSKGDRRLASAGFSARSGFLTSATYGGISWLAHSSLQAGLWVKNQDRYNQLITAKRFTLAEAFKRAGWRTVDTR